MRALRIGLFLIPVLALAQPTDTLKTNTLAEVVIDGSILKSAKIAKNGLGEMDLPQAMSILHFKNIQQQQIASLTDVLKNVNGIYIMGTTGGYQEEIASRGSALSSNNTFKNGIRFFNGMKIELSGAEKIEILKGNTAIEYGNVAPGGVLNIITKKPKFDFGGSVDFSYGSFDHFKPQVDVYGALNKKKTIAFRLNSSYQQSNSFRHHVYAKVFYINPSLLFVLSKKSSLLIEGDITKSKTLPDFGAGIINYQIANVPRERFTGVSWGRFEADQSFISAKYNLFLSEKWDLSALVGYRNYNTELFANTRPNSSGGTVDTAGNWKRSIQRSEVGDNYTIQQVDANTYFSTGFLSHKILVGADAEQFTTNTTAYNTFANYDQINIFNEYNATLEMGIPTMTRNTLTSTQVNRFGVYAQDLISFPKYVKLLLGARYNIIHTNTDVLTYASGNTASTEVTDKPFSPKLGLIVQPNAHHTFFVSYSNSFSLNTGVDVNGNALTPSTLDQYEIGVKNRLLKGKLQLNITYYQINNNDLAQTSLVNGNTNSNIKELAGAIRSEGWEVDATYKPLENVSILLGYSYNDTRYTASNIYTVGSSLRYNPQHTANLSINYDIKKGMFKNMNIGFISQYFGERFAGRSTRLTVANDNYKIIPLDEYIALDVVVGYKYKQWKVHGKVSNLLNELGYNVHDDNSINPIAPINFSVNLGFTF